MSRHPGEFRRLRADRTLLPTAVEEILRYDAPFPTTVRCPRTPIEVAGQSISAGRVLVLLPGSANLDERRFAHPDRVDLSRLPNPHVSFGGGIHHCLGAALARLEIRVTLDRLLDRFASVEPAGQVVRRERFRSYVSVPVIGRPA